MNYQSLSLLPVCCLFFLLVTEDVLALSAPCSCPMPASCCHCFPVTMDSYLPGKLSQKIKLFLRQIALAIVFLLQPRKVTNAGLIHGIERESKAIIFKANCCRNFKAALWGDLMFTTVLSLKQ